MPPKQNRPPAPGPADQDQRLSPEQRPVRLSPEAAARHWDNPPPPFVAVEYQPAVPGLPGPLVEVGITPQHQAARLYDIQLKIGLMEVDLDSAGDRLEQQRQQLAAIEADWRDVRTRLAGQTGSERARLLAEFHRLRREQRAAAERLKAGQTDYDRLVVELEALYRQRENWQDSGRNLAA